MRTSDDRGEATRSARGRRVGFLLAGVQKGGTTSLYKMLAQHPKIAKSAQKELHYFDDEEHDWENPTYRQYHRRITWSKSATIAGESTPSYIFWPGAMERIKAYNPDMRLVLSFRDPVQRAYSQWGMVHDRESKRVPDFGVAIRKRAPERWPRTAVDVGKGSRAFVARGYYGEQLAHLLTLFPAEQVLVLDYHVVFKDLRATMDRITDFLGVEPFDAIPEELRQRARPQTLKASPPTEDDVAMLVGLYAKDLATFAEISGVDIAGWPTARVLDGSLAAADFAVALAGTTIFTGGSPQVDDDSAARPDQA